MACQPQCKSVNELPYIQSGSPKYFLISWWPRNQIDQIRTIRLLMERQARWNYLNKINLSMTGWAQEIPFTNQILDDKKHHQTKYKPYHFSQEHSSPKKRYKKPFYWKEIESPKGKSFVSKEPMLCGKMKWETKGLGFKHCGRLVTHSSRVHKSIGHPNGLSNHPFQSQWT